MDISIFIGWIRICGKTSFGHSEHRKNKTGAEHYI